LLLPIRWPEPFGLVFIEALACGLPVLTCPSGAAPEILREGITGFMRESDEELTEAALRVREVSRAGCRAWAEQRFDIHHMMQNYLTLYQSLQSQHKVQRRLLDIPTDARVDHMDLPAANQLLITPE
jgi:glycosyltransferase involved in cell wall biosynthesis